MHHPLLLYLLFFFNDTATTEIYTLSLHDALPICRPSPCNPTSMKPCSRPRLPWKSRKRSPPSSHACRTDIGSRPAADRKSTRLNSSHGYISYAVFCLKKKRTLCDNSTAITVVSSR